MQRSVCRQEDLVTKQRHAFLFSLYCLKISLVSEYWAKFYRWEIDCLGISKHRSSDTVEGSMYRTLEWRLDIYWTRPFFQIFQNVSRTESESDPTDRSKPYENAADIWPMNGIAGPSIWIVNSRLHHSVGWVPILQINDWVPVQSGAPWTF